MKKILIVSVLLIGFAFSFAQTSGINAIAYKTVEVTNGTWGKWQDQWLELDESERPEMYITAKFKGTIYEIRFKWDLLEMDKTLLVQYNEKKTLETRKKWNDETVNVYKDEEGDWVYTQKFSLNQLTENTNVWTERKDAKIYFFDKEIGILFK